MKVYEVWTRAGSPHEHEVTVSVPADGRYGRGGSIDIPGLGVCSIEQGWVLGKGDRDVPDGEIVVRLDVTSEPDVAR
jgi:hypothetical protein